MILFPTLRLRRAARQHFGWHTLRDGQVEAARAIVRGRDALVVLPTGAGKSAIFQLPAMLLRGPTIVISPLLALQQDQVAAVNAREVPGLRAVRVNSTLTERQREAALASVASGESRLLYITPEQLADPARLAEIKALKPALIAVDEAHCITSWGHDFRPDYLALGHLIKALGRPPVVALTATASPPSREDIAERLGMRDPKVVIGKLDRSNLFLAASLCPTEDDRWRRLVQALADREGDGIVYVPTRRIAEETAARLTAAGRPAVHYHAGLTGKIRAQRHADFTAGRIPIMVTTSAFGMGIDKPDIRWIIHLALPDSPDSYMQEIGRAGRDGRPAHVLLLHRPEDLALQRFFAGGAPPKDELLYVAAAVASGIASRAAVAQQTGLNSRRVAAHLALLESIGAVTSTAKGELSLPRYAPEPDEAAKLAVAEAERHRVLQRSRTDMMRALAESGGCRVRPLLTYFGEALHQPCGHCDNCARAASPRKPRRAGNVPYPLHSSVRHEQWGLGTVLGYADDRMTVLFTDVGYKTLSVPVVRERKLLEPA
jgi:ATP-dependent DNA helicase RecQ